VVRSSAGRPGAATRRASPSSHHELSRRGLGGAGGAILTARSVVVMNSSAHDSTVPLRGALGAVVDAGGESITQPKVPLSNRGDEALLCGISTSRLFVALR
jgi:hypothetical protein